MGISAFVAIFVSKSCREGGGTMANQLADAVTNIVAILEPLLPDARAKVVTAALTLLGDNQIATTPAPPASLGSVGTSLAGVSPAAGQWMQKNGLTLEQLNQFVHIEAESTEAIALPGNSSKKSEQTINAYLLQGVASLIVSGQPAFSDETARKLCEHFGCYDLANHSKTLKDLGNRFAGSKAKGWRLTAPGLTAVATLIRESAST
jgi:hypothetical protein